MYTVFRKKHPLLYLRGKCLDFHKIVRECLVGNKYSIGKKLDIFATGDVMLTSYFRIYKL